MSFTDDSGNVSLRDLTTGTNRRLTHTADWGPNGYANVPVVSPDGRQVAYVWYIHPENAAEVRIDLDRWRASGSTSLPFEPESTRCLTSWRGCPTAGSFRRFAVLPDRTSQIGTVTIENRTFRSIKSLEWRRPNMLSLSPDGRYLAYDVPATDAGSPRDIIVLATDGSQETTVVRNPANDSFPLWSPDGSRLLFLSDRTGRNAIMDDADPKRARGRPGHVDTGRRRPDQPVGHDAGAAPCSTPSRHPPARTSTSRRSTPCASRRLRCR